MVVVFRSRAFVEVNISENMELLYDMFIICGFAFEPKWQNYDPEKHKQCYI